MTQNPNELSHQALGFEHPLPGVTGDVHFVTSTEEQRDVFARVEAARAARDMIEATVLDGGGTPAVVDETVADFIEDSNNSHHSPATSALVGYEQAIEHADSPKTLDGLAELDPEVVVGAARAEIAAGVAADTVEGVLDRIPTPEHQEAETMATADYVSERLKKHPETHDTYNRPRPMYEIHGRKVVFRNRMEMVTIPDASVTVVAAESVPPLDISKVAVSTRDEYPTAELLDFNSRHTGDVASNILSVPNTPLGIAEAGTLLGSERAVRLKEKLLKGEYTDPECRDFVDGILGVTTIDDNGRALDNIETDGFAIALAALAGDKAAGKIVEVKRVDLLKLEAARKEATKEEARREMVKQTSENRSYEADALPLDKMFIVHSTPHNLEFDEQGNAIFRPAGQYESTALFPRASWHATINSGIFDTTDTWGTANRLVIASLSETMNATGDNLEVLDGLDSWFVVGPGETIKLPQPTIIEATGDGTELIQREGNKVKFLLKEQYSEAEQAEIERLADKYGAANIDKMKDTEKIGADTLKEACLQLVLAEKGLSSDERDEPVADSHSHSMSNAKLAQRIQAAALSMGLRTSRHPLHAESYLERQGFSQAIDNAKQEVATHEGSLTWATAALGARRQVLVNGCMPAAEQRVKPPTSRRRGII